MHVLIVFIASRKDAAAIVNIQSDGRLRARVILQTEFDGLPRNARNRVSRLDLDDPISIGAGIARGIDAKRRLKRCVHITVACRCREAAPDAAKRYLNSATPCAADVLEIS